MNEVVAALVRRPQGEARRTAVRGREIRQRADYQPGQGIKVRFANHLSHPCAPPAAKPTKAAVGLPRMSAHLRLGRSSVRYREHDQLARRRARLRYGRQPSHRARKTHFDPRQSHHQRCHQQRNQAHSDSYRCWSQVRCRLVLLGCSVAMICRLSSAISLLNA